MRNEPGNMPPLSIVAAMLSVIHSKNLTKLLAIGQVLAMYKVVDNEIATG